MISHSFNQWYTSKAATCTVNGTQTRICSYCGYTETQEIASSGHNEVEDRAVSATCSSTGLTKGSHCSKCGTVLVKQTTTKKTDHKVNHGTCSVCNTVCDAYDALAYYVLCNGSPDDDGEEFCIINKQTYNGGEYYYFVYTDSEASTLSFRSLSYVSNTEVFLNMEIVKNSVTQEVYMGYKSLGYTDYTYGKIYSSTFSSDNIYVYDYKYQGNFSSLSSKYKSLFGKEINLLLMGVDMFVLDYYNTGITMPMLGFKNY